MKLSKKTLDILKNFSAINTNILIKAGNTLSTKAVANNIFATVEVEEEFETEVGIFNLPEFLGVLSLFTNPDIKFSTKYLTLQEGSSKIKYVYADSSILVYPDKSPKTLDFDVEFNLTASHLVQLQKAAAALGVQDIAFECEGKKIVAKVLDKKNDSSNNYIIELETESPESFTTYFKVDNFKFLPDDYTVFISKKNLAKWNGKDLKTVYYVAAEADSRFS